MTCFGTWRIPIGDEYRLVAEPRADLDVAAAFHWYEGEEPGAPRCWRSTSLILRLGVTGAPFLEAAGGHTFLAGGLADLVEH
jgi:hypothetical protein